MALSYEDAWMAFIWKYLRRAGAKVADDAFVYLPRRMRLTVRTFDGYKEIEMDRFHASLTIEDIEGNRYPGMNLSAYDWFHIMDLIENPDGIDLF